MRGLVCTACFFFFLLFLVGSGAGSGGGWLSWKSSKSEIKSSAAGIQLVRYVFALVEYDGVMSGVRRGRKTRYLEGVGCNESGK